MTDFNLKVDVSSDFEQVTITMSKQDFDNFRIVLAGMNAVFETQLPDSDTSKIVKSFLNNSQQSYLDNFYQ